jgi:hypothetical protein
MIRVPILLIRKTGTFSEISAKVSWTFEAKTGIFKNQILHRGAARLEQSG